jgi:hypothetical protein
MSELEKLMRQIAKKGYHIIGTYEKDFGQRPICEYRSSPGLLFF